MAKRFRNIQSRAYLILPSVFIWLGLSIFSCAPTKQELIGKESRDLAFIWSKSGSRTTRAAVLEELEGRKAVDTLNWLLIYALRNRRTRFKTEDCLPIVQALGRLKDPKSIDSLYKATRIRPAKQLKLAVLKAYKLIGNAQALYPTKEFLNDPDPDIRLQALETLAHIEGQDSIEAIYPLLFDSDPNIRWRAVHVLGEIGDPRAIDKISLLLADEDDSVRQSAEAVLIKLGVSKTKVEDWRNKAGQLSVEDVYGAKMSYQKLVMEKEALRASLGSEPASITEKRQALPRIWLFAVGISQYRHENIDLAYAAKDALDFYNFMLASDKGHLKEQQAVLLINDQATRANIISRFVRFMKRPMPEDLVIVYLATHGLPDPEINELNFVAYDTDLNNLLATGVSQSDISRALAYGKANKVLIILDSCHSGQLEASIFVAKRGIYVTSMKSFLSQLTEARDGVAILSASSAAELSEEGEHYGGGHGAFTFYLLEALRGKADANGDSIITLRETYDYVYTNVAQRTGGRQHPELKGIFDNELPLVEVD